MIKKIIKTVRGFTQVELVILLGIGALVAGSLIFMATKPTQMAQMPPVNINVQPPAITVGQPNVNVNVEAPQVAVAPAAQPGRTPSASASVVSDNAGTFTVYPTGSFPTDV